MAYHHKSKSVTEYATAAETETDDLPYACDRCLGGEGGLLKMAKQQAAKQCNLCKRPYTNFTWRINERQRNCVICKTCARKQLKCQSCLSVYRPRSRNNDDEEESEQEQEGNNNNNKKPHNSAAALQLSSRHRAPVCSFFLKGKCTRDPCPFSHDTSSSSKHVSSVNDIRQRALADPNAALTAAAFAAAATATTVVSGNNVVEEEGENEKKKSKKEIDEEEKQRQMYQERQQQQQKQQKEQELTTTSSKKQKQSSSSSSTSAAAAVTSTKFDWMSGL